MPITVLPAPDNSGMMATMSWILDAIKSKKDREFRDKQLAQGQAAAKMETIFKLMGINDASARQAVLKRIESDPSIMSMLGGGELGQTFGAGEPIMQDVGSRGGGVDEAGLPITGVPSKIPTGRVTKGVRDVIPPGGLGEQMAGLTVEQAKENLRATRTGTDINLKVEGRAAAAAPLATAMDKLKVASVVDVSGKELDEIARTGKLPDNVSNRLRDPETDSLKKLATISGRPLRDLVEMRIRGQLELPVKMGEKELALKGIELKYADENRRLQNAYLEASIRNLDEPNHAATAGARAAGAAKAAEDYLGIRESVQKISFNVDTTRTNPVNGKKTKATGETLPPMDSALVSAIMDPFSEENRDGLKRLVAQDPGLFDLSADQLGSAATTERFLNAALADMFQRAGLDIPTDMRAALKSISQPGKADPSGKIAAEILGVDKQGDPYSVLVAKLAHARGIKSFINGVGGSPTTVGGAKPSGLAAGLEAAKGKEGAKEGLDALNALANNRLALLGGPKKKEKSPAATRTPGAN